MSKVIFLYYVYIDYYWLSLILWVQSKWMNEGIILEIFFDVKEKCYALSLMTWLTVLKIMF